MLWILLLAILTGGLFYAAYYIGIGKRQSIAYKKDTDTKKQDTYFYWILAGACVIRILAAILYRGHETDMNCFSVWSEIISKEGFQNFYSDQIFSDYPPGYLYALYLIGMIRKGLQLSIQSRGYYLLLKLPAILSDLGAGILLYKISKKRELKNIALIISAVYLLNPVVILNSSVWGQIDGIFTLLLAGVCYLLIEKKLIYSYFLFGIGILIKPQTLVFTPIVLLVVVDEVILKEFEIKKFLRHFGFGCAAIGMMLLLCLPFGLEKVIGQYIDTLGSYPYASINAYNLWSMLGLNWKSQEQEILFLTCQQWGTLAILGFVAASSYFYFKLRREESKIPLLAAFLGLSMFTLSVRMHERYLFPVLLLILVTYSIKPKRQTFMLYISLSVLHFINEAYVLFFAEQSKKLPVIGGMLQLLYYFYFVYYLSVLYQRKTADDKKQSKIIQSLLNGLRRAAKPIPVTPSEKKIKFSIWDWGSVIAIVGIYTIVAFWNLGDRSVPETAWKSQTYSDNIVIDLGEIKKVSKLAYYLGVYENRELSVEIKQTPEEEWRPAADFTMNSVFAWGEYELNSSFRYLRLISYNEKLMLNEFVMLDENRIPIMPVNPEVCPQLFDEQELFPKYFSYRNSTYFDEIYHARTAYEFTQGLYSYENTHPPMGKILIAFGIASFGMNPFGWRFMGTVFGIAMLIVCYLFAKKIVKSTALSAFTTILLAVDFMHFTQTRIATIDVFVVFFILLMYYFMYCYSCISFYDTKLSKTWVPLGACGISMGFAVACKWTGIYAGIGLGVIFFQILWRRYREYQYAVRQPKKVTDGIAHSDIIKQFPRNAWKTILFCCVFFVVIPFVIYLLSYIPFVDGRNYDLFERMIKSQETMLSYHSGLEAQHPFSSSWYQWPGMVRPVWYYSGHLTDTIAEGISAFGNPAVWWGGFLVFLLLCYQIIKKKDRIAFFLCLAYSIQILPWVFVSRITFLYHYFPCVPFLVLMIGYMAERFLKRGNRKRRRAIIFGYAAVCVGLFILFYPVLSGSPIERSFVLNWLTWLDTWILI